MLLPLFGDNQGPPRLYCKEYVAKIRVRLFHWHEAEAAERAARLIKAGFDAHADHKTGPGFGSRLRSTEPQAIVIDLSRLPSHGREVALYLRRTKSLRLLPLILVSGEPKKVALIQQLISGAVFVSGWAEVPAAIRQAVNSAPSADAALAKPPRSLHAAMGRKPAGQKIGLGARNKGRPHRRARGDGRISAATGGSGIQQQSFPCNRNRDSIRAWCG